MARIPDVYDHDDVAEWPPVGATCTRCGQSGLEWHNTGVRWRLVEPGTKFKFHECGKASADEFDVVK